MMAGMFSSYDIFFFFMAIKVGHALPGIAVLGFKVKSGELETCITRGGFDAGG